MSLEVSEAPQPIRSQSVGHAGNGADVLVECLIRAGVHTIFGLPGDTGIELYDALSKHQGRIRHILTRDERHAAAMADVYARCTNNVGVLEVSSGAGMTYAIGALGEAHGASVPLLVVASDIHRKSRGSGAITEIDAVQLFSAVTKWAAIAQSAAQLPHLVSEALSIATSGRPGPVALVVPVDVLEDQTQTMIPPVSLGVPHERPLPDERVLEEALRALHGASRPAIVAGSGIHFSAAWDQLDALSQRGGIPVATTIHGKGAIADSSPLSLGVVGANGARPYANNYLASADVVLFVGTRANSTDTNGFTTPRRDGTVVIHLDIASDRAGRNYPGSIVMAGDAQITLAALVDGIVADEARAIRIRAWIAKHRQAWEAAEGAVFPPGGAGFNPKDVVSMLARTVGEGATVVADPGTPTPYLACYWEGSAPGRKVIIPRGHGCMGFAIPGAIGAAIARPGTPVLALTTDGSFPMACGELETVARYGLPITFVHFTNGSFGWIKMHQHLYLERRYFGVDHGPINAVAVAEACGIKSLKVATIDALAEAVRRGRANAEPMFIDLEVADELAVVPPVAPWVSAVHNNGAKPPVY